MYDKQPILCIVIGISIFVASVLFTAERIMFERVDVRCKEFGYTKAVDTTWCVKLHGEVTSYQKLSALERIKDFRYP